MTPCILTHYGPGAKNADGTRYGSNRIAADLPFGTVVRVSYGGRVARFVVHDRGGKVHGRHFDVPDRAFLSLCSRGGFVRGRVKARYEIVKRPKTHGPKKRRRS